MNVDLVYLWVDGKDPEWLERRNTYLPEEEKRDIGTFCEGRILDNDELMYSLRSVEMYAPWINNIFIVTDNQTPRWLDTSSSKVTIVNQSMLFGNENLPTYNSVAIEQVIVNIPGLSEYFIYANDDMMFNRAVSKGFFFTSDGRPINRFGKLAESSREGALKTELMYSTTINEAGLAISRDFKKDYFLLRPHHNIDAYRKSLILECQEKYRDWSELTINNRFRTKQDMQRHIFTLYALATSQANAVITGRFKIKFKKIFSILRLIKGIDSHMYMLADTNIREHLHRFRPALVCFNDGESSSTGNRDQIKKLLAELYPNKSQFEI